jgi:hypothetical protein
MTHVFTQGIDGAGFINVISADPFNNGRYVAGGDVSGIHRTDNYGGVWSNSTGGVYGAEKQVASIVHSKKYADRVYAATDAGVFESVDGGQSWTKKATLEFNGGNNSGRSSGSGGLIVGLPSTHPRSTGVLIVLDEATTVDYLYVATLKDGLYRSTDRGVNFTRIANAPITGAGAKEYYARTLVQGTTNPDTLFMGCYDTGGGLNNGYIWKVTNTRTAPAVASGSGANSARLTTCPPICEELFFIGTTLYGAFNTAGIWKSTDQGVTWTAINSGIPLASEWQSVTGYVDTGGNHVVYVGCANPVAAGGAGYEQSVMKSTNGGTSWTCITLNDANSTIGTTIANSTGEVWWLLEDNLSMALGKGGYVASQLTMGLARDPDTGVVSVDKDKLFVAGRSGVWRTRNAQATDIEWYPVVKELGATINRAAISTTGQKAITANTDWVGIATTNRYETSPDQTKPSSYNTGYYLAHDGAITFMAAGQRDDTGGRPYGGDIFSNPDPSVEANTWTDEGLSTAVDDAVGAHTGSAGWRTLGVTCGRDASNNIVLLAAVEQQGIWRKVLTGTTLGTGTWTLVTETSTPPAPPDWSGVSVRLNGAATAGTINASPTLRAVTAMLNWVDIQPTATTYDFSSLDASIADAHTDGYKFAIRIMMGCDAPIGHPTNVAVPSWMRTHATRPVAVHRGFANETTRKGEQVYTPLPWDENYAYWHSQLLINFAAWLNGNCPSNTAHKRKRHVWWVPFAMPTEIGSEMTYHYRLPNSVASYSTGTANTIATPTTLGAAGTSFTIGGSLTGWPTGNILVRIVRGGFPWQVATGAASDELVWGTRSGTTVTVQTNGRGFSGTTAQSHPAGTVVNYAIDDGNLTGSYATGQQATFNGISGVYDQYVLNRRGWENAAGVGGAVATEVNRLGWVKDAWRNSIADFMAIMPAEVPGSLAGGAVWEDNHTMSDSLANQLGPLYPGRLMAMVTDLKVTATGAKPWVYPNTNAIDFLNKAKAAGWKIGLQTGSTSVVANGDELIQACEDAMDKWPDLLFIEIQPSRLAAGPFTTTARNAWTGGVIATQNEYFLTRANENLQDRIIA